MNKKYYDGFNVIDILFKNLEPRKMWKVLNEFAESDGVDAAEVVRCCDCRYCNVINSRTVYAKCELHGHAFEPFQEDTRTHFCSWAERKEV